MGREVCVGGVNVKGGCDIAFKTNEAAATKARITRRREAAPKRNKNIKKNS